MTLKGIILMC